MCGFDTRDRKKEAQIIPLLACSKPISNHTASLGFSGPEDEVELILSRAAVFTQPANINSIIICPLHREKLGLGWRRGSTSRCREPMFLCFLSLEAILMITTTIMCSWKLKQLKKLPTSGKKIN